jgi:hypothetical protein
MSLARTNDLVAQLVGRGLDENLNLYVNPLVWSQIVTDEAAARNLAPRRAPTYEVGAEGIKFYSQAGTITIKPSIFVKRGDGFLISPSQWMRVGATDVTFRLPDRGDEFFLHIPTKAGYELRAYSNQAMFTKAPSRGMYLYDIA